MGEELCAWIKLNDGHELQETEVREFCKGKISHFKVPKYIDFVAEFPTTVTGKIQKFVMRDTMKARLQQQENWVKIKIFQQKKEEFWQREYTTNEWPSKVFMPNECRIF